MRKVTINTLNTMKQQGERFSVLAAYDASFSQLIAEAGIECLLVGDSLGMTIQGHDTTVPVTLEQMCYHVEAVRRGNHQSLIIGDMPFGSYNSIDDALLAATALMQAGSHMVKLEGGEWLIDTIAAMTDRGIPVCAHLGLTPQSVNKLGGYRVQGRDPESAEQLLRDALDLQRAGADMLVLECVPTALATEITDALSIPVIGIGAGPDTDAQVLVVYDMLGITPNKTPKFSKNFLADTGDVAGALKAFHQAVSAGTFPGPEHGFK